MSEQQADLERALRILSDPTRMRLIRCLLERNYCVRALSCKLGVSESAVSQHIKALRQVCLLEGVKYGYHMHYAVNRDALRRVGAYLQALSDAPRAPSRDGYCGCDVYEEALCRRANAAPAKEQTRKDGTPAC